MKVTVAMLAAASFASLVTAQSFDKIKAGFIYVGPVGDYGWTNAHDAARKIVLKEFPWLQTLAVESVPEANAGTYIDQLVKQGCNVIFTTSFGYMDATIAAAQKYPDVIFAHASGFKRAPNSATYMADFYQVYYLDGLMAGALTKSNKIGYVGNFPLSETKRHIDAFALGIRAVNPKATVNVRWINSFYDPAAAKEATEALVADGNDVFAFTEDSPTVVQVSGKHNLPSFSHYSPMQDFSPKTVVSGQLVHWDVIYKDFLSKIHNGTYTTKNLENVDY
ncbi:MAG TPA: BMP family ABC transporter substrate-binding protein, partial [Deinococcales bacterium]|nr:BMP family ABC transporter substrate-binding protein [Deinococcales bacterium]